MGSPGSAGAGGSSLTPQPLSAGPPGNPSTPGGCRAPSPQQWQLWVQLWSLLTISICFSPMQLLAFLQGLFTFYHHGYELAKDFSDFKTELTISIQNVSVPGVSLCPGCPCALCPSLSVSGRATSPSGVF